MSGQEPDIANLIANSGQAGGMVLLIYMIYRKFDSLEKVICREREQLQEFMQKQREESIRTDERDRIRDALGPFRKKAGQSAV